MMPPQNILDFTRFPNGYLLYDGKCGVCTNFIGGREAFYHRHGYGVAAVQDPGVSELLDSIDASDAGEMRLLRGNGALILGANVYRDIASKIWWAKPIYFLSVLPVFSGIFDFCYRRFAANRSTISKVCGLELRAKYPS